MLGPRDANPLPVETLELTQETDDFTTFTVQVPSNLLGSTAQ